MRRVLVIDDQRIFADSPDTEWTHETTSQEGIDALVVGGPWDEIWLDHDLGMESYGSGYDLVSELVRSLQADEVSVSEVVTPDGQIWVHSMNPVGADRMVAALAPYFSVARIDPTPFLDFDAM